MQKYHPALIIKKGKEVEFFKMVNYNRPTQEFWDDCRKMREGLTKEFFDGMNQLMERED